MAISMHKTWVFFLQGFRLAWAYKLQFASRYVAMIVAVLLFFYLDRLLGRSGNNNVDGATYFAFAMVGSALLRYLNASFYAFSNTLREEMLMGTIEPLIATATSTVFAMLGPSLWLVLESVWLMVLQLVIGALIGIDFSNLNWLSTVVVLILSSITVSSFSILGASFTIIFKRGDPVSWLINAVAYVFSGVYFPIDLMPLWLRAISYALPTTYALNALRGAMLQGKSLVGLAPDLVPLLLFTVVLLPISIYSFRHAIHYLKRTGELAHY